MENLTPTAAPIITEELNDLNLTNDADQTIDLTTHFDDPFTTGQVARFELYDGLQTTGVTEVLLFDQAGEGAPIAAENFINYANDGDYTDSIIHRSVSDFIIQGGGFVVDDLAGSLQDPPSSVTLVPSDPPIQNEFSAERSNILGTIAFAKLDGDPDSATNQFFFNLNDNSGNLDNQNGGFTVFGEVLGSDDLEVLEAIADLPTSDQSSFFGQGAFTDLPLIVDDPSNPVIDSDENLVRYQEISILQRDELEFEVVSNSNPAVVTLNLAGGDLALEAGSESGSTTVTVRATNLVGAVIEDTFTITVSDTPDPEPPNTDNPPTTTGIEDITVEQDSEDEIISLFDAFSDQEDEDDALTYTVISNSNPELFDSVEIDATNGELTLDYAPDQSGQADIEVEATDTNDQTVSTTFSVTVNPENAAPVGVEDSFEVLAFETLVVSAADGVLNNDTDGEGDSLVASIESEPQNGTLEFNEDGSFSYTPNTGFAGTDSFSYTASDSNSDSEPTNVSIEVDALPPAPTDVIQGSDDLSKLKGTQGSDFVVGVDGGDRIRGRKGNDTLDGGNGDDDIKGQKGNDLIDGGDGNDFVRAGRGQDTVFGGAGNDYIKGQKGDDLLTGGAGIDLIVGQRGDDTLIGGEGNDTLEGGRGADLYVLSDDGGVDGFLDFKIGRDRIGLAGDLTLGSLTFDSSSDTTDILLNGVVIANVELKNSGDLSNQSNFVDFA